MQTLDPPGVFARTLAECLAIQLKDQNRYDPMIAALLDNLAFARQPQPRGPAARRSTPTSKIWPT